MARVLEKWCVCVCVCAGVKSLFAAHTLFILKDSFKISRLFILGCHYYIVYCMDHSWKRLYSLLCSPSQESLLFYLFVYLCIFGGQGLAVWPRLCWN